MKLKPSTIYQLPTTKAAPRVAIVHDWLIGGGAERVVEELHHMYPDAPIYTSYCTPEWRERLDGKVVTGWLQHFGRIRKFIPLLRIWWFTHLDFSGYDLVISSSGNGEAFGIRVHNQQRGWFSNLLAARGAGEDRKGGVRNGTVIADRNTQQSDTSKSSGIAGGFAGSLPTAVREPVHVNYCHAPTHYYWRFYDQYLEQPGFGFLNPLARLGLKLLIKPLRAWDHIAAQRPDYFIANSTHIQSEIKQFYGRDSIVIHPPVDTLRFSHLPSTIYQLPKSRKGFVTAARQVPQKKLDIIIGACNELKFPLTVIGRGPEHDKLVRQAGDTITFKQNVSDAEMPELFASAEAFLFASYEDFGVTPVEAMAAGTPVLAYKAGGAMDYIKPGITGEFFDVQSVPSLCAALLKFNPRNYDPKLIASHAETFSKSEFKTKLQTYITGILTKQKKD